MPAILRTGVLPCPHRTPRRAALVAAALLTVLLTGCYRRGRAQASPPAPNFAINYSQVQFTFNQGETSPAAVELRFQKSPAAPLNWRAVYNDYSQDIVPGSLPATAGFSATGADSLFVSFDPGGKVTSQGWSSISIQDVDTGKWVRCDFALRIQPESLPVFAEQPADISVNMNDPATFHVTVIGRNPTVLQWQRNGVDIPGATGSSLYLPSPTLADDGAIFQVVATNPLGVSVSRPARLSIYGTPTPPTLSIFPNSVTLPAYATYTLYGRSYDPVVSYQWQRNGIDIPGATTTYLYIVGDPALNGALYTLRISNRGGTVTSSPAVITVVPVTNPFNRGPLDQTRMVGDTAEFTAYLDHIYSGGGFQWQENGVTIPGATDNSLTIPNVTLADNGSTFRLVLHLPSGDFYSAPATLTVVPNAPPIPRSLLDRVVMEGDPCYFEAEDLNTEVANTAYQWQRNGIGLPGETHPYLSFRSASLSDNGAQYSYTLTTPFGAATSNAATLTVRPHAPVIQVTPNAVAFQADADSETEQAAEHWVDDLSLPVSVPRPNIVNAAPWLTVYADPAYPSVHLTTTVRAARAKDGWNPLTAYAEFETARVSCWINNELLRFGGETMYIDFAYRENLHQTYARAISEKNAPPIRFSTTAVWTGSEVILWGGDLYPFTPSPTNHGDRYDPAADTWNGRISLVNAPTARTDHVAVWTGTEMLIWGGRAGDTAVQSGARYNPATDSWTAMTTAGAPSARYGAGAVWTGTRLLVWGGRNGVTTFNDGGFYDPATNTWSPGPTLVNAPSSRANAAAVWDGTEMYIVGGDTRPLWGNPQLVYDGARYNPATDTWTAIDADLPWPLPNLDGFVGFCANNRVVIRQHGVLGGDSLSAWVLQPAFHLDPGTYTDTVILDDPGALNGPQTLAVTLTVRGTPAVAAADLVFASATPLEIDVAFSVPIDPATITNANMVLEASGGDSDFTNGNEIPLTPAALTLSDPTHLVIDLTGISVPLDLLRLTLNSGGIQSIYGTALDGETNADFPTGDGTPGGDYVTSFTVD